MATQQIAQGLAGLGRYGDSTLVHMQPEEVAGLQALAKTQGTSLTINPQTGLPEAFNLGGFFKSLLPVFVGAATGGAGLPLYAGIAAGAATGALTNKKDPLMGAVTGGMGGYGGFNIGQGFASAGAGAAAPAAGGVQLAGSTVPSGTGVQLGQSAAQQIGTPQLNQALAQSGVNFDPIARGTAQNIMTNTGPGVAFKNTFAQTTLPGDAGYLGQGLSGNELMSSGAIGSASPGGAYTASQGLQNMGQGIQNLATGQEGSWGAFKQGLAGAGKAPVSNLSAAGSLGLPVGGAILGGLEPSDLYGKPMRPGQNPNEKYDPYRSLNLSGDTGLRFYAQGGPVSFAEGGAMQGGGSGAMQGGNLNLNTASGLQEARASYAGPVQSSGSRGTNSIYSMAGGTPAQSIYEMAGGVPAVSIYDMANSTPYAAGGPVSFADGGDTGKDPVGLPGGGIGSLRGGENEAMEGSSMLPIDVSDINAKYGYNPEGLRKQSANPAINAMAGNISNMGGFGARGAGQAMPSIPVPRLGLFADNSEIESARTAYEKQLAAAMSGRGGMGSPYGFGGMGQPNMVRGMKPNSSPMDAMTRTMEGSRGIGSSASTAPTAETALSRLNLNQNYADGGYVNQFDFKSGGLNSLAEYADNSIGYAEGGETRVNLNTASGLSGATGGSRGTVGNNGIGWRDGAYTVGNPQFDALPAELRNFIMPFTMTPGHKLPSKADILADSYYSGNTKLPLGEERSNVNLDTASGLGMAKGGYLDGPGDGMSDSIPATIEGKQKARLADGEFVIPADVVSHVGNGSTKAGAKRFYKMLADVRKARTGSTKQGKQIKPEKYMPA